MFDRDDADDISCIPVNAPFGTAESYISWLPGPSKKTTAEALQQQQQ